MTGIIKMRMPAKAKIIMTPRIISHRNRIMSILVGHPGLSGRLTRNTAADCLISMAPAKTEERMALSTKRAACWSEFGDKTRKTRGGRCFGDNLSRQEGIARLARYLLSTTQVGTMETWFPSARHASSFPPAPSLRPPRRRDTVRHRPNSCLPGSTCRVPSRLLRDTHHLQPRQREEHLAGALSKDEDGVTDGMTKIHGRPGPFNRLSLSRHVTEVLSR
ncbi:hypothetical protein F5883DRAFT_33559 [Diaporthe sp. PMI_573]|nr:hypothetical protein F5883DRAFT_33559 [Diaporthaceae sp. PMI_573]